jgi:type IV pilus assembly protein PilC
MPKFRENTELSVHFQCIYQTIMFFSPRYSTRETAQLCQRLSIAIDAGIEVRKIWANEANRAHGFSKRHFQTISEAVSNGHTMAQAMNATGDYFPVLMRELTAVGEETGKLDAVYKQLADHFERRLQMRRTFLGAIAWPMFQLAAAICVIGLLIWILGVISDRPMDMIGFGLTGTRGLAIYCTFIACVAIGVWLVIRAIGRGLAWTHTIQHIVLRIPKIGQVVETLCLARFVWTFYITLESGMEIRRAIQLSLKSTNHAYYTDRMTEIDKAIAQGNSLHESFSDARCFPREFLDALAVGEQSGRLSQAMETQSRQYQDQARIATTVLTTIAGFAVWMIIAALIITMIFRIFFTAVYPNYQI